MKILMRSILILIISTLFFSCDLTSVFNERELPTDNPITIYNSNLEKTNKMDMLDTLYVELSGLKPNRIHEVEILDPDGKQIVMMRVPSDEDGIIPASPLWYDVGLKDPADVMFNDGGADLSITSFYIHVTGPGTDYKEPFYFVYSSTSTLDQPKPIVWACDSNGKMENAFQETGSPDSFYTEIYVKAAHLPLRINGQEVSSADIYILPAKEPGHLWEDGENLADKAIMDPLNIGLLTDSDTNTKYFDEVSVWDLNGTEQLINPDESNNSYTVIVDLNRNGLFDAGEDVDGDQLTDRYIDGIDGQGVAGFIVQDTEAWSIEIELTDPASGLKKSSLIETNGSYDDDSMNMTVSNLPSGLTAVDYNFYKNGTTVSVASDNISSFSTDGVTGLKSFTITDVFNGIVAVDFDTLDLELVIDTGSDTIETYERIISLSHYISAVKRIIIKDETSGVRRHFHETGTTNSDLGGSDPYSKIYITTELMASSESQVPVYVFKSKDGSPDDFFSLEGALFSRNVSVTTGNISEELLWDLSDPDYPQIINPGPGNNRFTVVIDTDSNGYFDSSTDIIASPAFEILDTPANAFPETYYVNIASGGKYTYSYDNNTYRYSMDYDYRDEFSKNGLDTKHNHYASYYSFDYGYGVKATWNPYIKYYSYYTNYQSSAEQSPSIYYGTCVDVYVVEANPAALVANGVLGSGLLSDITPDGYNSLPVQYSCMNGLGQQNIWKPYFDEGSYYVIVDINRDGLITEHVDLIDAVSKDGTTILDDSSTVGFKVE